MTPQNEYYVNKTTARVVTTEMGPEDSVEPPFTVDKLPDPALASSVLESIPVSSLDDSRTKNSSFVQDSSIGDIVLTYNFVTYEDHVLKFMPYYDYGEHTDLAYKTYKWDMTGYTGPATMGIMWVNEQRPAPGTCFIAFSDWVQGVYDYYPCPDDNVLTLPDLSRYINIDNEMLVMVIIADDGVYNLASLQMGTLEMRGTGGAEYFADTNSNIPDFAPTTLPDAKDLDVFLPGVGDQQYTGSCVVWALTYSCLNAELAHAYNIPVTEPLQGITWDISDDARHVSPRYNYVETLYWEHNIPAAPPGSGAGSTDLVRMLISIGTYTASDCPWTFLDENNNWITYWDSEWWQRNYAGDTSNTRLLIDVEDYWSLPRQSSTESLINNVKTALAVHERPVYVTLLASDFSSSSLYENTEATYNPYDPSTYPYITALSPGSNHALAIVGYNDAVGPGCFKVRNSWGASWMSFVYDGLDGGYFWVTYDAIAAKNPYMLILKEEYNEQACAHYLGTLPSVTPPVDVNATEGDYNDRIRISWDPVPGATSYIIYKDDPNSWLATTTATSYTDSSITNIFAHTYFVAAVYSFSSISYRGPLSRPELGWINHLNAGYTVTAQEALAVQTDSAGKIHYSWMDKIPDGTGNFTFRINEAVEQQAGTESFTKNPLYTYGPTSAYDMIASNCSYVDYRDQEGLQSLVWSKPTSSPTYNLSSARYMYQLQEEQSNYISATNFGSGFDTIIDEAGPEKSYLAVNPTADTWNLVAVGDDNTYHNMLRSLSGDWTELSETDRELPVLGIKGKTLGWSSVNPWRIVERSEDAGAGRDVDRIQLHYGCPYINSILFNRVYATNAFYAPKAISIAFNTGSSFCDTSAKPTVFTTGFSSLNENLATISIVGAAVATDYSWDYQSIEWCTTAGTYNIVANHGKFGDAIYIPARNAYALAYLSGVQSMSYGLLDIGDLKLAIFTPATGWTVQTISTTPAGNACSITTRGNEIVVAYTGYATLGSTITSSPQACLWTEY